MKEVQILVGNAIREVRTQQGLTQADLAATLEVDKGYISRLEGGAYNLTLNSLAKIATALNVEIVRLFK